MTFLMTQRDGNMVAKNVYDDTGKTRTQQMEMCEKRSDEGNFKFTNL